MKDKSVKFHATFFNIGYLIDSIAHLTLFAGCKWMIAIRYFDFMIPLIKMTELFMIDIPHQSNLLDCNCEKSVTIN